MIPVLDWNEFESDQDSFVAALGKACRDTGFFLLKNHTVPEALLAQVFEKGDQFFALPDADKALVSILNTPHFRGWAKQGDESLDETSPQIDTKETFNIGLDLPSDDPLSLIHI